MRSLSFSAVFPLKQGLSAGLLVCCALVVSQIAFAQVGLPDQGGFTIKEGAGVGGEVARNYSAARVAFDKQDWSEASQRFRDVSRACPGSPLSLQCDYFEALSQWNRQQTQDVADKLSNWLIAAKAFQAKNKSNAKLVESFDSWVENTHLILARFDAASNRLGDAEYRLRKLLDFSPENDRNTLEGNDQPNNSADLISQSAFPSHGCHAAAAWNELGQLLQTGRQNIQDAKRCYEHSVAQCEQNSSCLPVALWGMASCCIADNDFARAREYVDRLSDMTINDEWTIRVAVLKANLIRAASQTVDGDVGSRLSEIHRTLEPVAALALASNPPALALYELAMALVESGDQVQCDQVMLHLLQLYPSSPYSVEVRVRLANSMAAQGDETKARALLDEAIDLGCPGALKPHAHLLRGTLRLHVGQTDGAKNDFEIALQSCQPSLPIEVSIRFQLSETLYQLKLWNQGKEHWQWLLDYAAKHPESKSTLAWLPVVMLRQAEMLAFQRSWKDAETMVCKIREDFPECSNRFEVDYLLARCFISDARFEDARKTLRTLAQGDSEVPKELVARARWMTGESFVMQQRYETAIEAYRHVLALPGSSYWHSSALLQIGQCCEALGDIAGARDAYTQFLTQYAQSPLANNARERLLSLPTAANVANQPGRATTGTKR